MNSAATRTAESVRLPAIISRWFEPTAVGLRQVPLTVSYALVLASITVTHEVGHTVLLVVGALIVLAVQLIGSLGRWTQWSPWQYALPLAQMVALVLLELGAGVERSYFLSLVFIPVASLALQPGLLGTVLAIAGATAVITLGVTTNPDIEGTPPAIRVFVVGIVAAFVAIGTHGATDALRRQADDLTSARDELTARAKQLVSSRDLLRSVMAAATEQAVVATDADGTVVAVSTGAERMFERPQDELLGTCVADLFPPGAADPGGPAPARPWARVAALVAAATADGATSAERTLTRRDGSARALEVVVTRRPPLSDELPAPAPGYLFVATDVTARHEAERLQDEFIGLVSHELRTPLSSILGYVELLQLGGALSGEDETYVDVIDRNARRLLRMVDDLLTSVQLTAGTFTFLPEQVDVVGVVRELVTDIEPTARRAEVQVVVAGDDAVPLRSDPGRLGQVVGNVLGNAVKFSARGATVTVKVTGLLGADGRRRARIVVTDTGSGIAPDDLARITERFYRSSDARRRRVRGVGIGLSVVQAIVDAHGGTITIRSQPGEGTVVEIDLPDLTGRPAPAASPAE